MILLAVETSDRIASAALMADGSIVASRSADETRRHAETLAPLVEEMLCANGVAARDVDYLAVDAGPGSFTGVRIGVCFVNALALAADKRVIAVDSLQALATGAAALGARICALIDAGNGNAYAAQYEGGACVAPPAAVAVEEYLPRMLPHCIAVGSGALAYRDAILSAVPGAQIAPESVAMPRADAVLRAAAARVESADRMAKPLYLRPSQAERMLQKRMEEAGTCAW